MQKNKIYIYVFVAMIITAIYLSITGSSHKEDLVACTEEAKICPDGTSVTRSGPLCEFSTCPDKQPVEIFNVSTKTVIDWLNGVEYEYPTKLSTTYVTALDWLPKLTLSTKNFTCDAKSSSVPVGGINSQKIINGDIYCVDTASEGAAGSTYTTYQYKTTKNQKLTTLEFTLRSVQCDNYDDPKKTDCKKEQKDFSPDNLAKDIISTIKLISATNQRRQCYTYTQNSTTEAPYDVKENIDVKIDGSTVSGTKSGNQSGPDMTNGYVGTLKGSINNDVITVIYDYVIEGSKGKEQEEYKIINNSLIKQRYPLVMKDNVLTPDKTGTLKQMEYKPMVCVIDNNN